MKRWIYPLLLSLLILAGSATAYTLVTKDNIKSAELSQDTPALQTKPTTEPATKEELLRLVNEERAKNGVTPLQMDERLNQSAQAKCDDMDANNYIAHSNPATGKHGYEYVKDFYPDAKGKVSENIQGVDYNLVKTSNDIVFAWVASTSHHEAMINKLYTFTGFGICKTAAVEHFYAPN